MDLRPKWKRETCIISTMPDGLAPWACAIFKRYSAQLEHVEIGDINIRQVLVPGVQDDQIGI
jgi:hypothetical protein